MAQNKDVTELSHKVSRSVAELSQKCVAELFCRRVVLFSQLQLHITSIYIYI